MNRMKRLLCLGLICYFCCLSMIVYGNEKAGKMNLLLNAIKKQIS